MSGRAKPKSPGQRRHAAKRLSRRWRAALVIALSTATLLGVAADVEYATLAELADAERISRSYVSRVLRLTLLAPEIVERILDGRPTAGLAQFLKPFPVE